MSTSEQHDVNHRLDVLQNSIEMSKALQFRSSFDLLDALRGSANAVVEGSPTPKFAPPQMPTPTMRHGTSELGKYKRFVPVAQAFASMSRLDGTKVGCLVLGSGFEVLSSGWNGAPRRSKADVDTRNLDRPTRLAWTCHAEANAVANAARSGAQLEGSTAIVTLMPCMTCAKLLVQAGVIRVLCPEPTAEFDRWKEEFDLTRALFNECFVDLIYYDTIGEKA